MNSYQSLLPAADVCQAVTIALSLSAYVPQWKTFLRNKSSANASLRAWYLWLVSAALSWAYSYVLYRASGRGMVLLVSNTAILGFITLTIALIHRYRHRTEIQLAGSAIDSSAALPSKRWLGRYRIGLDIETPRLAPRGDSITQTTS